MSESIGERVMQEIEARLNAATAGPHLFPAGWEVERDRREDVDDPALEEASRLILYTVTDVVEDDELAGTVQRTRTVFVEARAAVETGVAREAVLDVGLTWATRALLRDRTLGGLVTRVRERGTVWGPNMDLYIPAGAAAQRFEVEYTTREDDPEASE